jgi:hypothetical protein
MNPRQEDLEAVARAIDRVVFHEQSGAGGGAPAGVLALVSYLNDSFPRVTGAAARRERLQRRLVRALRIPPAEAEGSWARLEAEMNRRLANLDSRWTPVVGGAALVLLGVLGVAVWRQRGVARPPIASAR